MTMQHKFFPNRLLLWQYLQDKCQGIDFQRTLRLPICSFSIDGKDYLCRSSKQFIDTINEMFNLNFDANRSNCRGQKFTLVWWDDNEEKETSSDVREQEKEEEIVTAIDIEYTKPTIEDLKNLYDENDKKGSKDKLELVAKNAFGISLNKRLTFENMIIELEGQLES